MSWTNKITPGRGGPAAQRPHGGGVCAKEADLRMTTSGTARRDVEGLWDAAGWLGAARKRSSKPGPASLFISTPIFFLSPARKLKPPPIRGRYVRPPRIRPPDLDPGEVCPPAADPAGPTPAPAASGLDPGGGMSGRHGKASSHRARRSPAGARRPRSEGGRSATPESGRASAPGRAPAAGGGGSGRHRLDPGEREPGQAVADTPRWTRRPARAPLAAGNHRRRRRRALQYRTNAGATDE
ncbi:unnamed protein product [Urochloa humidicola]